MNLVGISSEPQLVIKGAVIIAAVFLSSAGGVERISNALARLTGREKPARSRDPGRIGLA
jgi:ribose transport system permease protein